MPATVVTFRQDPAVSRETFVLGAEELRIVESSLGMSKERIVKIADISAEPEMTQRLFHHFYLIPLIYAAVAAVGASMLMGKGEAAKLVAIVIAIFVPVSLARMIRGFQPVKACRFRDRDGAILFEVYRYGKSRLAFDEFVSAVRARIGSGEHTGRATGSGR